MAVVHCTDFHSDPQRPEAQDQTSEAQRLEVLLAQLSGLDRRLHAMRRCIRHMRRDAQSYKETEAGQKMETPDSYGAASASPSPNIIQIVVNGQCCARIEL